MGKYTGIFYKHRHSHISVNYTQQRVYFIEYTALKLGYCHDAIFKNKASDNSGFPELNI